MKRHRRIGLALRWPTASLLLLGALFLLGGAAGCAAAGQVQGDAGAALQTYLGAYLSLPEGGAVRFASVVWEQLRIPLLVLLMGFTAAGIVGIPILFALRGFLLAFCVACFCRLYGWSGLAPAAVLFGLPALLWAPALFVLGVQALDASRSMLCRCVGGAGPLAFCQGSYWARCAGCACALALCAALEYWVLPALVGAAAKLI
jgi:hypothetical protein